MRLSKYITIIIIVGIIGFIPPLATISENSYDSDNTSDLFKKKENYFNNYLPKTSSGFKYDYDFTDDVDGEDPEGWTTFESGNSIVQVNESQGIQVKVVELYDNGTNPQLHNYFTSRNNGTIQAKVRMSNTGISSVYNKITAGLYNSDCYMFIRSYNWYYGTNEGNILLFSGVLTNQWYWINLSFDCIEGIWNLEVRLDNSTGELKGSMIGQTMHTPPTSISRIVFELSANLNYMYVDDVDFGWTDEYGDDSISPTWDSLLEFHDPLEYGNNISIFINVYDASNISFVYLEFENINYTMSNIGNTYSYFNWIPTLIGINFYQIWMSDEFGNINYVDGSFIVQKSEDILIQENLNTILSLFTLFTLIVIMLILYFKVRIFLLILNIFLFSLVFGAISMLQFDIPFSPYLQTFFLLFQTTFFIMTVLDNYKKTYKIRKG